jgi:glycosyltransferase involved in cell wall biosynthesis
LLNAGNHGGGGLDARHHKAVGPLISVLMPVQNGVRYVGEAIDSIMGQTLTDWQLVIIDNASTDGTDAYVRRRAAQDPRIVFQRNEDATGNFSAGLAVCRGEWIACMDAADRALPNRLERQLAFMLQNRDVDVVSCLAHYINADGEHTPAIALDTKAHDAGECAGRRADIMRVLHRGAFMRRETLARAASTTEEIELMRRLAEAGPILVQPEYLMEYRFESDSQAARLFDLANHEQVWAEDCLVARRAGNPAPAWAQVATPRRSRPLQPSPAKSGGPQMRHHNREGGRMLSAALRIAGELALWPRSSRLSAQLLSRGAARSFEAGEA